MLREFPAQPALAAAAVLFVCLSPRFRTGAGARKTLASPPECGAGEWSAAKDNPILKACRYRPYILRLTRTLTRVSYPPREEEGAESSRCGSNFVPPLLQEKEAVELEFHQLEQRYERLRVSRPEQERRLLTSLAEVG